MTDAPAPGSVLPAIYELENQIEALRGKIAALHKTRKLPDKWRVGHKVRYVRTFDEYGPKRGEVGKIAMLDGEDKPAAEYQVFWVRFEYDGRYWTNPDDVEWVDD